MNSDLLEMKISELYHPIGLAINDMMMLKSILYEYSNHDKKKIHVICEHYARSIDYFHLVE